MKIERKPSNYIVEIRDQIEQQTDVHGHLLDLYTLLAFTTGINTTLENVHDAWAIWKNNIDPEHRSLKPFDELDKDVQELDRKYAEEIIKVARHILHT